MKCPWTTVTHKYNDYEQTDRMGYSVETTKTEFGECVQHECPYFGNKDQMRDVCLRMYRR